jgi:DNA invertase Pin-like site-specific DNA recombinase
LNALTRFKEKKVHFVSISERIDTNSPVGIAIFSILAAIAQLERDLIAMRVKIGLENARAKGKQIGRKKLRNSVLIRELLKAGLSFRQISSLAKCSHGSVSAEKKSMLMEEEAQRQKLASETKEESKPKENGIIFPKVDGPQVSPTTT